MTVYSNVEPTAIFVDKIENGVATVLMRTNITSSEKTDQIGNTYVEWQYDEEKITVAIPSVGLTSDDVKAILESSLSYKESLELVKSHNSYISAQILEGLGL